MEEKPGQGIVKPEIEESTSVTMPFSVILYNDDWHTFDEVINQIMKATECGLDKARKLTFEVHVKGKANVYQGELSICLKVVSVLEEIELHTQIVSDS